MIYVLNDEEGKILKHEVDPTSQSGDWSASFTRSLALNLSSPNTKQCWNIWYPPVSYMSICASHPFSKNLCCRAMKWINRRGEPKSRQNLSPSTVSSAMFPVESFAFAHVRDHNIPFIARSASPYGYLSRSRGSIPNGISVVRLTVLSRGTLNPI